MAITKADIKLMASKLLDDTDEGGGPMSATEIVDGVLNNLYPDISRLDRTTGRVSMRKGFLFVDTNTDDPYYGAHVCITNPPDDPGVTMAAFTTSDPLDIRADAKDRVEGYVVAGPIWPGFLFADHISGVQVLQIIQRESAPLPDIGDVLHLYGGGNEQFVRVTDVDSEIRQFTDVQGRSFNRRIVSAGISEPLRYDFEGEEASAVDAKSPATQLRETVVADASKYYGVAKLVEAAVDGDLSLSVDTIYTHLVPAAQSETPVVDMTAGGELAAVVDAQGDEYSYNTSLTVENNAVLYCGSAVARGSVSISGGGHLWQDDGGGFLVRSGVKEAVINYASGEIRFEGIQSLGAISLTVTASPAAAPTLVSQTQSLPVTINNRGTNWVANLQPTPAPGSLVVDYMAQGKWYRLKDDGTGVLSGAVAGIGAGSVDYATGSVVVTCGALPDVDTEIIFFWSGPVNLTNATPGAVDDPYIEIQCGNTGLARNTVSVSWNDGQARTLTDDGLGNLTGSGSGTVRYAAGVIRFTPATLPSPGTIYAVDYDYGPPQEYSTPAPDRDGNGYVTITLPNAPLLPGTVELNWTRDIPQGNPDAQHPQLVKAAAAVRVRDNGSGGLIGITGTVNYTTGEITFDPDASVSIPIDRYEWVTRTSIFAPERQPPSLFITYT